MVDSPKMITLNYTSASRTGLTIAFFAQGLAWPALSVLALGGDVFLSLKAIAWVHLVALGWLATFATSVVMSAFEQRHPHRISALLSGALVLFLFGWVGICVSLWSERPLALRGAGIAVAAGLAGMLGPIVVDALSHRANRTITGYGLAAAASFFLITAAVMGLFNAFALGSDQADVLRWLPQTHAHVALLAWVAVLLAAARLRMFSALRPSGSPSGLLRVAAIAWFVVAAALGVATLLGAHLDVAYGFALMIGCIGNLANAAAIDVVLPNDKPRRRTAAFSVSYQCAAALAVIGIVWLQPHLIVTAGLLGLASWFVLALWKTWNSTQLPSTQH